MKHPGLFLSAPLSLALVGALLAASTLAMAQPSPAADAHARYEQERQKCMTHSSVRLKIEQIQLVSGG